MDTTRSSLVNAVVAKLQAESSDFNLVKPYQGELEKSLNRQKIQSNIFPAEVSLTTPFALVISKSRKVQESDGRSPRYGSNRNSLRLEHFLSVYVGVENAHDFSSSDAPVIWDMLSATAGILHGQVLSDGKGPILMLEEGEYLVTTDLFEVYEQKYFRYEIGF